MDTIFKKINKYNKKIKNISSTIHNDKLSHYVKKQSDYLDSTKSQVGGFDLEKIGNFIDKGLNEYKNMNDRVKYGAVQHSPEERGRYLRNELETKNAIICRQNNELEHAKTLETTQKQEELEQARISYQQFKNEYQQAQERTTQQEAELTEMNARSITQSHEFNEKISKIIAERNAAEKQKLFDELIKKANGVTSTLMAVKALIENQSHEHKIIHEQVLKLKLELQQQSDRADAMLQELLRLQ